MPGSAQFGSVDAIVAVVVLVAAARGFFRGLLREVFGLLALGAGLLASVTWSARLAEFLPEGQIGAAIVRDGIAFVAVFVVAHLAVTLLGLALDRVASSRVAVILNRGSGVLFGGAKGVAVAAVCLLFVHLFSPLPSVDAQIMASPLARPLVSTASGVLHLAVPTGTEKGG